MEPTQAKITTFTTVKSVYEHKTKEWISGVGGEAVFAEVSHGWFVHFEGSWEAIFLGRDKPSFTSGDRVKITFEKVPNA